MDIYDQRVEKSPLFRATDKFVSSLLVRITMANKYVTGLDEVVKNLNNRVKKFKGEPTLKGLVRGQNCTRRHGKDISSYSS